MLIGRPNLTLVDYKCHNIVCGLDNKFKMYKPDHYICQCGFEIEGKFEIIKHAPKLYCGIKKCNIGKTKMDMSCVKCEYIRER
jgi:hypothetical protein